MIMSQRLKLALATDILTTSIDMGADLNCRNSAELGDDDGRLDNW